MAEQTATDPDFAHPVIHAEQWVDVTPGERLAQLHSQYELLKVEADEAAARLKACTDAIKLELTQQVPGHTKYRLPAGPGPELQLTYVERWTIDSRKLKAEDPLTYVRYAKKGGSWTLKVAAHGQHGGQQGGEQ
jgi:hypothetical protein